MNNPNFKELVRLNIQTLTSFPYIEQDFDALTNYELLCKVVNELNKVIENQNITNQSVLEMYQAFNTLKNYVDNYFANLDVQEEVNIKLDEMASDGTLTNLIKDYIDPIYQTYETIINDDISNYKTNINEQISTINSKVDAATSGSPLVASSTSEMTDTTRVYVNTTDGKWYYYDGDSWEIGGTYQATGINQDDYIIENIKNALNIGNIIEEPTEENKCIRTDGDTVNILSPISSTTLDYYIINCQENDVITITGTGGTNPRLWCFIDNQGNSLSKSLPNASANNLTLIAPENSDKLILNLNHDLERYVYFGSDVNNKIKTSEYLENNSKYKANAGISVGETIDYDSHVSGLYNVINHTVFSSQTSYHNQYTVNAGDEIYVSGKTGGNGTIYSLIVFLDENNNNTAIYGTDNLHTYTDMFIIVPKGSVKAIVNGAGEETISIKKAVPFEKTLKEVYEDSSSSPLPDTLLYNLLSKKQVGVFSKPYICFSSDDGESQLYTNTIPNILEIVHDDTGIYIPFTFCLMSTSNVLQTTEKLNAIKDMVNNKNCSIAYHGTVHYTTYTKDELINYLDSEATYFHNKQLYPSGCAYPGHSHNNMVMTICGAKLGVACAGGAYDETKVYSSPRKNMFELYRTSLLNMDLEDAKDYIDYAYDHNYLLCFFFHDNSIASGEGTTQKVVDIIEYAITKGMNFTNIGDIPSLI